MDATEHERLRKRYAGMGDGELEKLLSESADLTDVAREALSTEIARRSLASDHAPVPDAPIPDLSREPDSELDTVEGLITIRQFRDLHDAVLAQGALQAAGIECFLADDNMVRLDWFISNLLGGVKLQVRLQDADTVVEILEQDIPEAFEVEGVGAYEQPHCPKCQSLDIAFERFDRGLSLASAAVLKLPIHIPENKWKCHSCGHEWQDTETVNDEN